MFGFGKKNVIQADDEMIAAFKEANSSLTNNIDALKKLDSMIRKLDVDLATAEKTIIALTQAINIIDTRVAVLEKQLSFAGIKFTNN